MDDVGELVELGRELTTTRANSEQLALAHRARCLRGLALGRGALQRVFDAFERVTGRGDDSARNGTFPHPPVASGGHARSCGAFVGGRPLQRFGATLQSARTFLTGAHGETRLDLCLARLDAARSAPLALFDGRLDELGRALSRSGETLLECSHRLKVAFACLLRSTPSGSEPLGLTGGGSRSRTELAEAFCDRGHARVGLVQPGQCSVDDSRGGRALFFSGRKGKCEPVTPMTGRGERLTGLVERSLDLQR